MQYKIDSSKLTLREWSWYGALLSGLIGKVFRIQNPSSTDEPPIDTTIGLEIAPTDIPSQVHDAWASIRGQLEALGFHSSFCQSLPHTITNTQYDWLTMVHVSGEVIARVTHRLWAATQPHRTNLVLAFISRSTSGKWLVSTSGKPDLLPPEDIQELRMVNAAPGDLWQAHMGELSRVKTAGPLESYTTADDARTAVETLHQCVSAFHVKRGVFTPPTAGDLAQNAAMEQARRQAAETGSQHPEVHAEIDALQRKQSSWVSGVALLVLSLVVFAGAGGLRWSWQLAVMLIVILFIHEAGHYIAMRLFKYRNLKMFFIPLLGAAVSGSHYNVPGWKKIIVSLMGPAPGIFLGCALGALGTIMEMQWLIDFSLLMVVVNGFNLLPILPFDGGWVMHALFFSRHHILDFVFRILATGGLALLGFLSRDKILMYLAIPMAIGLPIALKLARISSTLRKEQLPELSADSQTIPYLTADRIISEVKRAFPKGMTSKLIAQNTMHIFENINARPPGLLATIFYTAALVVSFGIAFLGAGFLFLAKQGTLAKAFDPVQMTAMTCEENLNVAAMPSSTGTNTASVIMTFDTDPDLREALSSARALVANSDEVRTFGKSLLVNLASETTESKESFLTSIGDKASSSFVSTVDNEPFVSLACNLPDEASAIYVERKAAGCFTPSRLLRLAPFWLPSDGRSPSEWEAFDKARQTYVRVYNAQFSYFTNKAYIAEVERLDLNPNPSSEAGKRQSIHLKKLTSELQARAVAELKESADLDSAVIDLCLASGSVTVLHDTSSPDAMRLAELLGPMRSAGQGPLASEAAYAAKVGHVARKGTVVEFTISFYDIFFGLPAFTQWLCANGATDLKYSISEP